MFFDSSFNVDTLENIHKHQSRGSFQTIRCLDRYLLKVINIEYNNQPILYAYETMYIPWVPWGS